ncbi:hypothetical protein ACWT_4346 [Actinoplanes sp. SE50]|uniref:hypothetical protein n=1 Tax=unclassified Actinoplanes TaxID=2626549 RepID=UPI00023EC812|nr:MULTISPECIES: hypothetical protein [unclassified Actinoplanes]AEV85366.1 hypothetical protein ACPL_4475 [Actinoplanes sp. SE50/110]ATO83761.1 hypothetical protein ACWT_4346 [Actinoplanes sp. SE50]SLM01169.1 hypothetical protein ACSP50_4402 [Actinoplanes sp. SE50/110]
MTPAWLQARIAEFRAVPGRTVTGWYGVEMAVREGGGAGPEFAGPDAPCLQLLTLSAQVLDGPALTVGTYQDDDVFGLLLTSPEDGASSRNGIFRARSLPELPVGPVDEVTVHLDADVLAEVVLRIGERNLLLIAGEAYENGDGDLSWHRLDESVLAFVDPEAAQALPWIPRRSTPAGSA